MTKSSRTARDLVWMSDIAIYNAFYSAFRKLFFTGIKSSDQAP